VTTKDDDWRRERAFRTYSDPIEALDLQLHGATILEITKVKTQHRPRHYRGILNFVAAPTSVHWNVVNIQKLDTWKFCDDELLKYLCVGSNIPFSDMTFSCRPRSLAAFVFTQISFMTL
jgi:hypothetical protein